MQIFRNDFYILYYKRRISVWIEESQCSSCTQKKQQAIIKELQTDLIAADLWKSFEKIIYNNIFEYLATNKLILANQSGFKPGDSWKNQLLSITHETYHLLDNGLEVKGVFLDRSKAFDKVWHEGLELKQYRISENLLHLIKCFLKNRNQRGNGQTSSWTKVLAGVVQGSVICQMIYPPILKTICRWYVSFFSCTQQKYSSKRT